MSFVPLTTAVEIRAAVDQLSDRIANEAVPFEREIGYQGGGGDYLIYWHPQEGIWAHLSPLDNRYWCCFGTEDAAAVRSLTITCEVNPPIDGIDRRCGGVFARDNAGATYLLHSGRVGGGRKGIGKAAFLTFYQGQRADVAWPDGMHTPPMLVVGCLDDASLLRHVAQYVRAVEQFKRVVVGGGE